MSTLISITVTFNVDGAEPETGQHIREQLHDAIAHHYNNVGFTDAEDPAMVDDWTISSATTKPA